MNRKLEAMEVMPAWTDPVTSLWESFAVLAALHHRDSIGAGKYIDLFDAPGRRSLVYQLPSRMLRLPARRQSAGERPRSLPRRPPDSAVPGMTPGSPFTRKEVAASSSWNAGSPTSAEN